MNDSDKQRLERLQQEEDELLLRWDWIRREIREIKNRNQTKK